MGLSISILISTWHEIMSQKLFTLACNDTTLTPRASSRAVSKKIRSFKRTKSKIQSPKTTNSIKRSSSKSGASLQEGPMPENIVLARAPSFNRLVQKFDPSVLKHKPLQEAITLPETAILFTPRPVSELDAAAVKVQKCYKGHRTRRNLADCAVVVEELWWKALDFASLKRSSVSFFDNDKQETAAAKWARAKTRVAKLGKGLSQNENAQKLALRHWLEAIDPRHRYGHNLNLYYDIWFQSESSQPFFYWLDIGDGKEISLDKCPRKKLHEQCIKYLGPKERETYEVVLEDGKLVYKLSRNLVDTIGDCKWIFVLSTARSLYVARKKKGQFQHSSFLAGAATTAAGRLIAYKGVLEAIWPYSGHYLPTEENFKEFISFLEENHVDLSNVKKCAYNEEYVSSRLPENESSPEKAANNTIEANEVVKSIEVEAISKDNQRSEEPIFSFSKRLSCKWDTGNGPRIGCVRDYPLDLQSLALEHVNLSPRITPGSFFGPIPSPRPSPKVRISPRIAYMGLPSPRTQLTMA